MIRAITLLLAGVVLAFAQDTKIYTISPEDAARGRALYVEQQRLQEALSRADDSFWSWEVAVSKKQGLKGKPGIYCEPDKYRRYRVVAGMLRFSQDFAQATTLIFADGYMEGQPCDPKAWNR